MAKAPAGYTQRIIDALNLEADAVDIQPSDTGYAAPRNLGPDVTDPPPEAPRVEDVQLFSNAGAPLRKGWLLLAVQKDNHIYQMDPKTGELDLVCYFGNTPMVVWRAVPLKDGSLLVSMSGTRWPNSPDSVAFGQAGYILHIRHTDEMMRPVRVDRQLYDPGELHLMQDGSLLVADFNGFGGQGSIFVTSDIKSQTMNQYGENRATAPLRTRDLYVGEPLREPVAVTLIGDDLYIANAFMHYEALRGPGGKRIKEAGAILKLSMASGNLDIVHDETGSPRGAIDHVGYAVDVPSVLYFTRNDWPTHEGSGVYRLDLKTGDVKPVIESTSRIKIFGRSEPQGANGALFVADSYNKRMLKVDAASGEVEESHSLENILGPVRGMVSPLDALESIVVIP